MKDFNAKIYEEYGFMASRNGFFKEWQIMTSSIAQKKDVLLDVAAEQAYASLLIQGSNIK
ncbi:hypothetical protein N8579_00850 [bacterium]|jgi:hypothetical protein|nr:hypothetical protein [bacterium]